MPISEIKLWQMSITLREVKENAEYNLKQNRCTPLCIIIGETQLDNYNKLIEAGETDDSDFEEAIKRHPELKLK